MRQEIAAISEERSRQIQNRITANLNDIRAMLSGCGDHETTVRLTSLSSDFYNAETREVSIMLKVMSNRLSGV